jgi:RNA polymerase sigma-70 factor (ECF subfamily)
MSMREFTVTELESSKIGAEAAEYAFHMDEQTFHAFYESTARPLWSYLSRILGNPTLAEDLVQESYFRFLRATLKTDDAAYQKAYLFRIATNLARDHWRRSPRHEQGEAADIAEVPANDRTGEHVQLQSDLGRALGRLKPREREILWLAYAEGSSHKEIAEMVGVRAASVRLLLFRARQKMLKLLRRPGQAMSTQGDTRDRF